MEAALLECPICFEPPTKPVVTACCHLFCWDCLHKSLDGGKRRICPLCRTQLSGGVIPLHGTHIKLPNHRMKFDGTLFDSTSHSLLLRLDSIQAGIKRHDGILCAYLDMLKEKVFPAMQMDLDCETEEEKFSRGKKRKFEDVMREANGWQPVKQEAMDLMRKNFALHRQVEEKNRQLLKARSGVVEEIVELLKAIASTNHLLPKWYPDQVKQTASTPVTTTLLCHICHQPLTRDPVATSCEHLFYWACLYTSFGGRCSIPCSVCRSVLRFNLHVVPVYASCVSTSTVAAASSVPPRPTLTPSSAIEKRIWHNSIRSDHVLTLQLVKRALLALRDPNDLVWEEVKIIGKINPWTKRELRIRSLERSHSTLVTQAEERVRRHRKETVGLSELAAALENLLQQPYSSFSDIWF